MSINSLAGAELYSHLSDLIGGTEGAHYILEVKLNHTSSPLAITKTSDVIQQSAAQNINYTLLDESGNSITSGGFSVSGSYNTTSSAYATHAEEKQEIMNLASKAAEEIHRRLMIYFSTHKLKE